MRNVLIGKNRRVTLEELECVALHDGQLEMHASSDDTSNNDNDAIAQEDISAITNALSSLEITDDSSPLSESQTIAALTLFALNLSQNRIMPSSNNDIEAAAAIVQLVNTSKSSPSPLRLSSSASSFLTTLLSLIPTYTCVISHLSNSSLFLPILTRAIPLAITSLSTIQSSNLTKNALIDAFAALSVERTSMNPATAFASAKYDVNRPHRGMMSSASVLRVITQGSKVATKQSMLTVEGVSDDVLESVGSIPSYHGPVCDVIPTAMKVLELECNCFEMVDGSAMDTTVIDFTCDTVSNACIVLLNGSNARSGTTSTTTATQSESSSLAEKALVLSKTVDGLYTALKNELSINITYIQNQNNIANEAAKKKAQEKAERAAAHAQQSKPTSDKNEFEGKSEAAIKKILKKRAEKEAKAAKKSAKKGGTGGASTHVDINIFGAGSLAIVAELTSSSSINLYNPTTISNLTEIITKLLSGGVQRKPKIAKGTRDYLPEQMMIRDQAFQIIRRVFKSHGAVEIDTPVFELKETLTGKYGEDSKLIYDLADQGGELLALRYDLTVPFARFLSLNSVGNIKRFHIGKVYRRDQPQLSKGRYREFYQCDFDIAGTYGRMVPDSECLCVASEILAGLPIGDFGIKLNHRRLLDAILDLCGVPSDKFRTICSAVDKLDKEPWSEVKREMVEDKGLKPEVADKIGVFVVQKGEPWEMYNQLMDSKAFGDHKGALEAMEDLRTLFQYLEAMGKLKYISFDLSLARGLDYYTGVIYEAVCMNGNTQVGSIGGGGRYDNLVSMFQEAGNVTPCVGVSVGIERVFTLMEERLRQEQGGSIKQPNVKVLVAQAGENMMVERMKVTKLLWDANISAEFSQQENPKLKYEIANALDRNIPFMVIIGEEEANESKCKVKDLNARTEETVTQAELASVLRKKGVIPVGCEFAAEMLAAEKN